MFFNVDASFNLGGFERDTVAAVYRGTASAPLACNDDAPGEFRGPSLLARRVEPGDYLVQVGAHRTSGGFFGTGQVFVQTTFVPDLDLDNDSWERPGDCNDANPTIHPGVTDIPDDPVDQDCDGRLAVNFDRDADGFSRPQDCLDDRADINPGAVDVLDDAIDQDCDGRLAENFDRDGDGFSRPKDCRDDRADVNPGAVDKPGDRIDQDCADGGDAPFPALQSTVTASLDRRGRRLRFTELSVSQVLKNTRVTIICARRCPFRRRSVRVGRSVSRFELTP